MSADKPAQINLRCNDRQLRRTQICRNYAADAVRVVAYILYALLLRMHPSTVASCALDDL
jgi:hypothetical protein